MAKKSDYKIIKVVQSNTLTQSRYDFTLVEKRAVYFIIKEVRNQFVERTDGQKDLFNDLILNMSTKELQKHDIELKEIYKSLISLRKKSIWIEDDTKILEVGYINYFEHQKRNPYLEVQVSKKILPYLVELAEQYTEYDLLIAMTLKTKYSQRFYEYCAQYKNLGFFKISVEELRNKLMLEDKYPRFALLKKYVLDVAQKELQELYDKGQCDLCFTYTGEPKEARTPKNLILKIISNPTEAQTVNAPSVLDLRNSIRGWLDKWLATGKKPKNKTWVDSVMNYLDKNPDLIPTLFKRLQKEMKNNPKENYAAFARHIIEEDFLP